MSEQSHEPSHHPPDEPRASDPAATADDDLLAALADDFASRARRGERPTVQEYVAKHPTHAERIRRIFPAIAVIEETRPADAAAAGEGPGSTIGRYKLLEHIGEGGFGAVYMAEQQLPVRRKVALKVLKPGMDTRQVLARFEAERQALAIMDHPNIAKVFDGGMTDSGRPYFVMELVKGVPVTDFCDQHHLTPRQRLELFGHVCHAVQHAHQKGIIHRDIKPTNVLVIMHDTTPLVKVIDFGVAKALGQELTEKTLFTGFAQLVGTPLYMSPEQAGQSALDIDTRSDIYSLGVLLYELLTGTTPFDKERFKKAAQDEIQRIIREEDPPTPSTRLSESQDSLASISAQRDTEPAKLTRLVRGELDWIVMKALEKDRNRRYETANSFAMDVQRYLADEPVLACPPSATYRLRKFARRNKRPVLAASLIILALVGGIIGATWGLVRARAAAQAEKQAKETAEAREAETRAVLEFVEGKVFAAARPKGEDGGLGREVTLRRALEAAIPFVEKSFSDQPLIEARLRMTLGTSFWFLGDAKIAAEQYQRARTLYSQHRGPVHPDTLGSTHNLAMSYAALDRRPDAIKLYEETLAVLKATVGPDHPSTLLTMNNLANDYHASRRHADALKLNEEALARMRAALGPDHPDTLMSMNNLANSYAALDRLQDALKLHEQTLPLMKAKRGPDHTDTLSSMMSLASTYAALDRHEEALKLREEALRLRKDKLGPDHPETLKSITNLAASYAALDRHEDALKLHQETLERRKAKLGPDNSYTLQSMYSVASSLVKLDRGAEAVPIIDECVQRAIGSGVDPRLILWLMDLRLTLFEKRKDATGCRSTAQMWERLNRTEPASLYDAARLRAVTAAVIKVDPKTPSADAAPLAQLESDRAMDWLRRAIAAGYDHVAQMKQDKDLDALREREDFKKLVVDLEAQAKP